jgi:hypothetical protein
MSPQLNHYNNASVVNILSIEVSSFQKFEYIDFAVLGGRNLDPKATLNLQEKGTA